MPIDFAVRPVTSARDKRQFLDFGYSLYSGNKYFVPPLRMDVSKALNPRKNPFFEHGQIQPFLAVDTSGEVVGRIAAIVNGMHLKKYEDQTGFFGFFEVVDDPHVATALLDAAANWLRSKNLTSMRGPTNPSMNDVAGLLVSGFDREPSIMMPYNLDYYESHLVDYGFRRAMTMWAYYIHFKYAHPERLIKGARLMLKRNPGLKIRNLDMSRFDQEAEDILDIYNDAWSDNWGHVDMLESEFKHLAKDMKQIVDPNIIYIVEDEGVPVAFSISLPNLNLALKKVHRGRLLPFGLAKLLAHTSFGDIHECRTLLMGVRKSHRNKGIDVIMNEAIVRDGPLHGYPASEMSWVLDSNRALINALNQLGGVVDKEYAMFEVAI